MLLLIAMTLNFSPSSASRSTAVEAETVEVNHATTETADPMH